MWAVHQKGAGLSPLDQTPETLETSLNDNRHHTQPGGREETFATDINMLTKSFVNANRRFD